MLLIAGSLAEATAATRAEATRGWVVEIDGEPSSAIEVFHSDYDVAWLLETPDYGILLVSPRFEQVRRAQTDDVEGSVIEKSVNLTVTLKDDIEWEDVAALKRIGTTYTWTLDGHDFTLKKAPPVLGRRSAEDLEERHIEFPAKSAAYLETARAKALPMRKSDAEDLMVRVYFGSWSPICERIVPKIMALEEAWGSVRFEYYGLPQPLVDDPHAQEMGITGVPTVVVFRGDEEVERISGRILDEPADAIAAALGSL